MPATRPKRKVHPTADRRAELEAVVRGRSAGASEGRRARILPLSDPDHPDGRRSDRRLAETVPTPRNGSWPNATETGLGVPTRQCIGRRFEDAEEMDEAIAARESKRNAAKAGARWRFATPDARVELRRLYPHPAR